MNSRTKRQSVPYIKLGYWASAETPSKVVRRVGNVQDAQEKLSHLASVSACGLLLQFVQTLTAFNQLKVDWGEPFDPMLDALSIFAFRFDLIKMQCIVTGNPVSSFRV